MSPIPVYAFWNPHGQDGVWQYLYTEPCSTCGRIHAAHGGGTGDVPDLAIGQTGWWMTHCIRPEAPQNIELILTAIVDRTEPTPGAFDHLSPLDKGKAVARAWRERTFVPCPTCPPHPSGELAKHKSAGFHDRATYPCDECTPLRPGVPRRHLRVRPHRRRAIRHYISKADQS